MSGDLWSIKIIKTLYKYVPFKLVVELGVYKSWALSFPEYLFGFELTIRNYKNGQSPLVETDLLLL